MKIVTQVQIKKILASVFISISALNAQAAIIDHANYFTDTDTGLSWLDVTTTTNRSFNDVSSQLGVGGEFDGWRYATGLEFNALLLSWTGVANAPVGRTVTTGSLPSVDGLITLFGSTLDSMWIERFGETWDSKYGFSEGQGIDFTLGILADPFNNDLSQRVVASIWDNEQNGAALDFYNVDHRQVLVNDPKSDIGSFLVREFSGSGSGSGNGSASPISEPQTIVLLGLGLAGLGLCRRKKV